jgi:hypothetical protein
MLVLMMMMMMMMMRTSSTRLGACTPDTVMWFYLGRRKQVGKYARAGSVMQYGPRLWAGASKLPDSARLLVKILHSFLSSQTGCNVLRLYA